MTWAELELLFQRHRHLGTWATYGTVDDGVGRYPLYRFTTPGRRTCTITAGFHGDEQSGPITLARHLPEIAARAAAHDVALTVYPCLNPSGFDACTRYNRLGERPNNDVLRYELADGSVVDELRAPRPFTGFHAQRGGPQETRALIAELERLPAPAAALDLHQDPYISGPLAYAYHFGATTPFLPLIAATEALLPIARGFEVDERLFSDENGLIVLHDASISDWFHRCGTPLVAVVETTTDTPLDVACAVNLLWIRGFIEAAAADPRA